MVPFSYQIADSLDDAASRAAHGTGVEFIAGGTDMLQLLQEGARAPRELIDLNGLKLGGIEQRDGKLQIGALMRLADVADDPRVARDFPLVSQALLATASPQVRNMATIGGNLLQRTRCLYFRDVVTPCNKRVPGSGCPAQDGQNRMNAILGGSDSCIAAYPGDLAVALLALDAELDLHGPQGPRRIPLRELHRLPGDTPHVETTLQPGEIITGLTLAANPFARSSYFLKLRDRASFEWALVSAAVALELDGRVVRQARIAVGGVGTRPWRLPQVEQVLTGRSVDEAAAHDAAERAADGARPRAGNAFKVRLLKRAVERATLIAGGVA